MSYTITVKVFQTNPNAWFEVVESTVWNFANGGFWTQVNDKHVLTMGGSGTSGILRFRSGDQYFIVALGVHNYKRWVDVSTSLAGNDTGTHIHPDYYTGGNLRAGVREEQRKDFDVTPQSGPMAGRRVEVHYTVSEGNNLEANIIIH